MTMSSVVSLLSSNNNGNIVPGKRVDSSTDTVKLGDQPLPRGWELGVAGACEGEQKRLILGPAMAWGEQGIPGVIPANSSVIIDVNIEKVERDLVFNFLNQISSGTFRRG